MRYPDPYDQMSDEEFHDWADRMLARAERSRTRMVTLRMSEALVQRVKHAAAEADIPYQVLMKRLIEAGVDQLELGRSAEAGSARTLAGLQRRTQAALRKADPDINEKRRAALAKARAARAEKKRAQNAS